MIRVPCPASPNAAVFFTKGLMISTTFPNAVALSIAVCLLLVYPSHFPKTRHPFTSPKPKLALARIRASVSRVWWGIRVL